jgi:hypothetical protein
MNKKFAETFNEYFVATSITENVKRQSKNGCINDDDDDNTDNHTHFMEEDFTKPYTSMECKCTTTKEVEQIIKSLKQKIHIGMMRYPHRS